VIKLLDLEADGKEIHLEIISKCLDLGYRLKEIPAVLRWEESGAREERRAASFQAPKLIVSHLIFAFYQSPIILIGSIALGLFICGSVIGLYLIYLPLVKGVKIGGRPLLIYMLLFILVGLITLIFCFLANQNRNIIKQINILSSKLNRIQQKKIRDSER
jgi:DNA-binding transcriptional MerR regulator